MHWRQALELREAWKEWQEEPDGRQAMILWVSVGTLLYVIRVDGNVQCGETRAYVGDEYRQPFDVGPDVYDSPCSMPADFDWSPEAVDRWIRAWMPLDDSDDRFRVGVLASFAAGLYWACSEWHGGMGCPLYSILSTSLYTPGCCETGPEPESSDFDAYTEICAVIERRHRHD